MNAKACKIDIQGIVQGVGFRPYVYRLARQYDIKGWVLNSPSGVVIAAEGNDRSLHAFLQGLQNDPPPLAVIRSCNVQTIEPAGYTDFTIKYSEGREEKSALISPDIAICEDCKRETRDPSDRRFEYPFTNCTNCGPRYTIIKDVPYDRSTTTMAAFPMCPQCQREYEDPLHRRFHAQPNACPVCGPHTWLVDSVGELVEKDARELLKAGHIIAVKGLGGFHLAADALNKQAVTTLRKRKKRDSKPFAVMVRNIEAARRYCRISPEEEDWLNSRHAPILILECHEQTQLPGEVIHPGLKTLGVMLPYTPLHYLLFDDKLDILIMTSANISDEPLITENDEALKKLADVADYFLLHNRDIYNPCDDSVMRVTALNTPQYFRRARGFVPSGLEVPARRNVSVLAVGGELKNTFCITRKGEAFLSQHWGDLNHYNNYLNFTKGITRFKKMLNVEPSVIAHDLHPDYQTTRWAREQTGVKRIAVQHHYAHLASVMVENDLREEVLGLICDGTGWGSDGAIWGGEILRANYQNFTRLAHLKYVPLPGGDASAGKPYRMALVYLHQAMGESGIESAKRWLPDLTEIELELMANVLKRQRETMTSSCGRLFDAVSAILGICAINKYEGQAAVELETRADLKEKSSYPYAFQSDHGILVMDVLPMWDELLKDIKGRSTVGSISMKFHLTLVQMFTTALLKLRETTGLNQVVLSGGVFHNQILLLHLISMLKEEGFFVYVNRQVPPGDGGISLGQAIIASEVSK